MEFNKFFDIFCVYKALFWSIILLSVACGAFYFLLQKQTFKSSLIINVTRDAAKSQNVYTYDDFYRLQADERFADTVVQWIISPQMREETKNVSGKLTAKRRSSQVIEVSFNTKTMHDAQTVAEDIVTILNNKSQKLNEKQGQDHWFIVQGNSPTVVDGTRSLFFLIGLCGMIGFFIAFWSVLIRHYFGNST
jgi:capsular polysaccharide biosynthesis protein